jgi:hypothetical protein
MKPPALATLNPDFLLLSFVSHNREKKHNSDHVCALTQSPARHLLWRLTWTFLDRDTDLVGSFQLTVALLPILPWPSQGDRIRERNFQIAPTLQLVHAISSAIVFKDCSGSPAAVRGEGE